MALKLTVTPSTNYIEDQINVKITGGTIPRTAVLFITLATTPPSPSSGGYVMRVTNLESDNNITINSDILNRIYSDSNWSNTAKTYVNFDLEDIYLGQEGTYTPIATPVTKTMYIEPAPPTFDVLPTYQDVDFESLMLTNDNQMIVRGMSVIRIQNINPTIYKNATISTIIVNGNNYSYTDYETLGYIDIDYSEDLFSTKLTITVIDSRGFRSDEYVLADILKFKYSYRAPKITEWSVERDGISETTILKMRGYYSEGYALNTNNIGGIYYWTYPADDTTLNRGATTLTVTKNATNEFITFEEVSTEYSAPHYIIDEDSGSQYYTAAEWEDGIGDLFSTVLYYNDKYTQEYLENDYDSENNRYYCNSGGYNGQWSAFWYDVLEGIYAVMYGDDIKTPINKKPTLTGDENGGNYEFEIEQAIQGNIASGFSMENAYGVITLATDSFSLLTLDFEKKILAAAIPAIDIYGANIAIGGIYDESMGGTQIEGELLADFVIETNSDSDWYWRKWKSGYVELFSTQQYTGITMTTASAGTYYGTGTAATKTTDLPFALTEVYFATGKEISTRASGVYIYNISFTNNNTKVSTDFRAHASSSNAACGVRFYITGKYN